MASGPIAGGGVSKAKRKWGDSGNKSLKRSKPLTMEARQEKMIPLVYPSNSLELEDDHHQMMNISLSSISKLEVKNLKRKLQTELNEVRSLIKRLKPRGNIAGDFKLGLAETLLPNKKAKTTNTGKKNVLSTADNKGTVQILKNCNNLLTKLMKHKFGWVFNTPVDANKLGLHDYHTIIKKPMDLGTVKTKLSKSWYKPPLEFAEDVRLTFNNAVLYNPKGHEVHNMAKLLLNIFEEKWAQLESQYEFLSRIQQPAGETEPLPPPPPTIVTLERAGSMSNPVEPEVLTIVPEKPEEEEAAGKRDLTFEEKRRLSEDLQDLPFDKLEAVVQIIKKRNPELDQHDDEIELDIDSLDLETLSELYRFVTEYKESLNKTKDEQGLSSEVNDGGSRSSNSSSSASGSCSSDSDSNNSGHGSDTGN